MFPCGPHSQQPRSRRCIRINLSGFGEVMATVLRCCRGTNRQPALCLFVSLKMKKKKLSFTFWGRGLCYHREQPSELLLSDNTSAHWIFSTIKLLRWALSWLQFEHRHHYMLQEIKQFQCRAFIFFSFLLFFHKKHSWDWRNVSVSVRSMKCNLCLAHPAWTAHLYST